VTKHLASVSGAEKARLVGMARGEEKYFFLYVVMSTVALTCTVMYSLFAGLAWPQSSLLVIGSLIVAWAAVFCFLEVHRDGRTAKNSARKAFEEDRDLYASRTVTVAPPTGEPYPHHEEYAESAGLDQGQLTSQLSGSTPFVDRFLSRPHGKAKA
jgi:hypothetical protein